MDRNTGIIFRNMYNFGVHSAGYYGMEYAAGTGYFHISPDVCNFLYGSNRMGGIWV
jgi:hypothetical protein